MKIAICGASGYTGKLALQDLVQRGIAPILIGRDRARLEAAAAEAGASKARIATADLGDHAALTKAMAGADAVISCVAPSTLLGKPIVRAAIAAGCHYVDTTGEQRYVKSVFDEFAASASAAGVAVMPATTDDCVPADLIAHLLSQRMGYIDRLTVAYGAFDVAATRGTLRSMNHIAKDDPLVFEDGAWHARPGESCGSILFPGLAQSQPQPVWRLGGTDVITIPRHVRARIVEAVINQDVAAGTRSLTPEIVDAAPEGPSAETRRAGKFTILVQASDAKGRTLQGHLSGSDVYGSTAVVAVEAAMRLAAGKWSGTLAAAEAFAPEAFLDALAPYGMRWAIDNP